MKQTAVEWLESELKKLPMVDVTEIFQQALEMEKEQIMDAYLNGCNDIRQDKYMGMHEYYNETYGKY